MQILFNCFWFYTFLDCKDLHANCDSWASSGYCASYATYMDENCKKSCEKCSDEVIEEDEEDDEEEEQQQGNCVFI